MLVFAKLRALQVNPSSVSDDSTFLGPAFLDASAVFPIPIWRTFLDSNDPDKCEKLIDQLVDRPEFADFCAEVGRSAAQRREDDG